MNPNPFFILNINYFILNIIIILLSIIIPQVTVVVLCGHWGNHLHWRSSLHPDNSQLIYFFSGGTVFFSHRKQKIHLLSPCFLSSLLDRKQRIHLSSSYFLVFFVSALHHGYCSVSALHHRYCSYFLPCSFFTAYTVRQFGCPLV